jgi:hypothetical protein
VWSDRHGGGIPCVTGISPIWKDRINPVSPIGIVALLKLRRFFRDCARSMTRDKLKIRDLTIEKREHIPEEEMSRAYESTHPVRVYTTRKIHQLFIGSRERQECIEDPIPSALSFYLLRKKAKLSNGADTIHVRVSQQSSVQVEDTSKETLHKSRETSVILP